MLVQEIMSSPAITVQPETTIQEVARIMGEHHISGVPVVDVDGRLLGTVTEVNLIARNAPLKEPRYLAVLSAVIPVGLDNYYEYKQQLRQALATNARQLMNSDVITVEPSTTVEEALEIMLNPEHTMLPVLENDRLVGVVTRTDLVRLIENLEAAPETKSS
ncbi:MAG: CBS domain-containing protein [Caldilineaceae bacterium]